MEAISITLQPIILYTKEKPQTCLYIWGCLAANLYQVLPEKVGRLLRREVVNFARRNVVRLSGVYSETTISRVKKRIPQILDLQDSCFLTH